MLIVMHIDVTTYELMALMLFELSVAHMKAAMCSVCVSNIWVGMAYGS